VTTTKFKTFDILNLLHFFVKKYSRRWGDLILLCGRIAVDSQGSLLNQTILPLIKRPWKFSFVFFHSLSLRLPISVSHSTFMIMNFHKRLHIKNGIKRHKNKSRNSKRGEWEPFAMYFYGNLCVKHERNILETNLFSKLISMVNLKSFFSTVTVKLVSIYCMP
jgi:hypothetical protein